MLDRGENVVGGVESDAMRAASKLDAIVLVTSDRCSSVAGLLVQNSSSEVGGAAERPDAFENQAALRVECDRLDADGAVPQRAVAAI